MAHEEQLAKIKRIFMKAVRTASNRRGWPRPLAPPPHPNSPVAEPNPGFLAALGANQVSLSPES